MKKKEYTIDAAHRFFGVEFNNKIFQLAEKQNLSDDEKTEIVSLAHASYIHWLNYSGHKIVNTQRALYMIAKAYITIQDQSNSMIYALKCLECTKSFINEMEDFDIAYSHEIMARAAALNTNKILFNKHWIKANELRTEIKNIEDLKWFEKDFNSGNWFGMKN